MININNIIFPEGIQWKLNFLNRCDLFRGFSAPPNSQYLFAYDWNKIGNPKISIIDIDTSHVTDMTYMFYSNGSPNIIFNNFNTSKVTSMYGMFYQCNDLTSLDLSGWDTSKVTDMYGVFYYCRRLTSLDLSGWDTSNVTTMNGMFYYCDSFTSLDLSHFNTSNVTAMNSMFAGCNYLTSLDISSFDFSKVTSISSFLPFSGNKLVDLRFGKNLKINWTSSGSPNSQSNLSKESLLSIIDGLYDFVGNGETTTRSCQFGSTNLAKLTDEEKALATNKGWTLT